MTEGTVTARDGNEIHYRLDGPPYGTVVVLAGSLGTTLEMWEPQAGRLSGLARVLRYDHRGHGGSSAPAGPYSIADLGQDLVDLLDGLDMDRASVCGLSLGGMVGMWAAAHHPDRVASLVLACTDAELGPPGPWLERASAVRHDGTASLGPALVERWFPARRRDPAVTAGVLAMLEGCDDDGYASCCEAIAGMDLRPDLENVRCPALVVGGAEDPVVPPERAVALATALHAGLLVLPEASHLANLSQPERFTEAVASHVLGDPVERGMAVRRAVLGDAHVDRAVGDPDPASRAFSDLITRYAWGEIWSRPGLDRRARSVVTLTVLVALGRLDELAFHAPAAVRNGLSPEEVAEVVLQCAVYAGVPSANSALPVVLRALRG